MTEDTIRRKAEVFADNPYVKAFDRLTGLVTMVLVPLCGWVLIAVVDHGNRIVAIETRTAISAPIVTQEIIDLQQDVRRLDVIDATQNQRIEDHNRRLDRMEEGHR